MSLSTIWGELPGDLTEKILSHLVDNHFYVDPAYTWSRLRHTSAHQKRVIEHRFRQFWLPKLSITLYAGTLNKFEHTIDSEADTEDGDTATFAVRVHIHYPIVPVRQESIPGKQTQKYMREAWASYDPATHRNITVRLGEGYLNGGCYGGYLVNDTDLPGLQVLDNGKIRFRWKEAVDELLREEMYMRRVGDEMFTEACSEPRWYTNKAQDHLAKGKTPSGTPGNIQVKIWRGNVQFARRVATLKHRAAKSLTVQVKFSAYSAELHKQEPDPESAEAVKSHACCNACSRRQYPDIFEVVLAEESVVPRLEVFQRWLRQRQGGGEHGKGKGKQTGDDGVMSVQEIVDLYRDEYACTCLYGVKRNPVEEERIERMWESTWREQADADSRKDDSTKLQVILLGGKKVRWELPPF